ncbi:MAG: PTS sugar transporter subunit IIA [Spirochaetales bacterium]|nr:PTS sugar transporter subunit IIA [Spirochaetales bacterium]MBP7263988.1 PTS sugar transporter subunit IIA [Spirochaetia bacterium]
MNLQFALSEKTAAVGMAAADKDAVIDGLIDILDRAGLLKDRAAARAAVLEREAKMSTGIKNGIAIPHGKTAAVDSLVACVAVTRDPVDFNALDGQPSRIFIMTLSPPDKVGPHLQFLAEVSQLFKDPTKRTAILKAQTAAELASLVQG